MSIEWVPRPDETQQSPGYKLMRCPADKKLGFICYSRAIIGVNVHFWKGRTNPCTGEDCRACDDKSPYRWRGYLCGAHPKSKIVAAIEITGGCIDPIDDYGKTYGSIRGAIIMLERMSNRANGAVKLTIERSDWPPETLPEPIDIQNLLMKLWDSGKSEKKAAEKARILIPGNGYMPGNENGRGTETPWRSERTS